MRLRHVSITLALGLAALTALPAESYDQPDGVPSMNSRRPIMPGKKPQTIEDVGWRILPLTLCINDACELVYKNGEPIPAHPDYPVLWKGRPLIFENKSEGVVYVVFRDEHGEQDFDVITGGAKIKLNPGEQMTTHFRSALIGPAKFILQCFPSQSERVIEPGVPDDEDPEEKIIEIDATYPPKGGEQKDPSYPC